ncbi:MAG: hypothetical protein FWD28_09400 [Treponema sp.]|nr:hypothetical protein [Treponema sp.]
MAKYSYFLIIIITFSCSSINLNEDPNLITDKNGVKPIEIEMPFFSVLRTWKEGKLATIDGWGRYAEISFINERRARLTPLVNFPRAQQDIWTLTTYPEASVITSTSGKAAFIADINNGITKSHIPMLTWVHRDPRLILIDPEEGLVAHQYILNRNDNDVGVSNYVYNYKTDTFVYKTPDLNSQNQHEHAVFMSNNIDEKFILSYIKTYENGRLVYDYFFYDWRNGERVKNELTETLKQNFSYVYTNNVINLNGRFLFAYNSEDRRNQKLIKISWDENYSNVQVKDLSNLLNEIYRLRYNINCLNIIISQCGSWVTAQVTDYSERSNDYNNRFITTRIFFHMDDKYPNGMSIPIFSNDNERIENTRNYDGAFVQHPIYGMCYAQNWRRNGRNYLRLYKMDTVLTVINSGSQSLPFNYDDSKEYLITRVYSYVKEFITGWMFEEDDTDIETNKAIDFYINFIESEMNKISKSESDYQLVKIELYRRSAIFVIPDRKARVLIYKNTANEDKNIYYYEIDFYIIERAHNPEDFTRYKIIICNQYFNFSESNNDVQSSHFWEFYRLIGEGETAINFFKNEMEKHRR